MSVHRERVALALDEGAFSAARMRLWADAAATWGNELAAQQATWEPHDWRDFLSE